MSYDLDATTTRFAVCELKIHNRRTGLCASQITLVSSYQQKISNIYTQIRPTTTTYYVYKFVKIECGLGHHHKTIKNYHTSLSGKLNIRGDTYLRLLKTGKRFRPVKEQNKLLKQKFDVNE